MRVELMGSHPDAEPGMMFGLDCMVVKAAPPVLRTSRKGQGLPVTFASLLDEMVDRDALPRLPAYPYTLGQASSYDRASSATGADGWYANGDGAGIVRTEINQGRTERVLMDEEGPGAVVRFWGTYLTWTFGNGTLRVYFDGATTPQIEAPFNDIVCGKHLVEGVLAQTTGGFLENGHILGGRNLYLPLPYASGCKITYEGNDRPFYYGINVRRYAAGTPVETFSMQALLTHAAKISAVQKALSEPALDTATGERVAVSDKVLAAGEDFALSLSGTRAIRDLRLQIDAADYRQALRSTILSISFDGVRKVWAPVGDFFCIGYKGSAYTGRYHDVTLDGRMRCRWVMPFRQNAELTIHNLGGEPVTLKDLQVRHAPWAWDGRSLYFHAGWRVYPKAASVRGRDTNYVTIQGRGKYVGDSLAIFNGVSGGEGQPWWGEGDEKIYVDGEVFPSNFGTGTEDYYGHAWVGCVPFVHPFLSQPALQGNRGRGLTVNSRWRALDAIPFQRSLKLDMEIWHWVNGVDVDYAPTTFWYGTAETRSVADLEAAPVTDRPNDVAGAQTPVRFVRRLEGEAMRVDAGSPGAALVHTVPTDKRFSNRSFLHLRGLNVGDRVSVSFAAEDAGDSPLEAAFVHAQDHGIVDVALNGVTVFSDLDLRGGVRPEPRIHVAKDAMLKKGANVLAFTVKDLGSQEDGCGLGIDYLLNAR